MKAEITRDVVSDLWPLYKAGEASADSRRLIEAFLAEDAAFRAVLEESETVANAVPEVALAPDADLRLIAVARKRIFRTVLLAGAAIGALLFIAAMIVHELK
jgi:hypothetical protein